MSSAPTTSATTFLSASTELASSATSPRTFSDSLASTCSIQLVTPSRSDAETLGSTADAGSMTSLSSSPEYRACLLMAPFFTAATSSTRALIVVNLKLGTFVWPKMLLFSMFRSDGSMTLPVRRTVEPRSSRRAGRYVVSCRSGAASSGSSSVPPKRPMSPPLFPAASAAALAFSGSLASSAFCLMRSANVIPPSSGSFSLSSGSFSLSTSHSRYPRAPSISDKVA
mmetsp:Transcript_29533/g.66244  ORF Transcript_29533/g.66244 Transcript_29533/m.66244 type:complete len:226 (-) Transcript_29533:321-998(-)